MCNIYDHFIVGTNSFFSMLATKTILQNMRTLILLLLSFSVTATNNFKHVINECLDGTHDCVSPQICQNIGEPQHAGFLCVCPDGFVENPALQSLRHTVPKEPEEWGQYPDLSLL